MNFGFDLYGPKWLPINFDITFNKSWNNNDIFFLDYNRDGIIDIVNPGLGDDKNLLVAFGSYNLNHKSLVFTSSSEYSPSPVVKGRATAYEEVPEHRIFTEIVKSWTAPTAETS